MYRVLHIAIPGSIFYIIEYPTYFNENQIIFINHFTPYSSSLTKLPSLATEYYGIYNIVQFYLYLCCNQLADHVKLASEHRVIVGVSKLFYLQCIPKV